MRKYFMTAFVLAAMLVFATSAFALEKSAMRATDIDGDWNAGTTCSVAYWNTCTGWVWTWSGWSPADVIGVCFDACCAGQLTSVTIFTVTSAPPGYNFTGTLEVKAADANCCPTGPALASEQYLPGLGQAGPVVIADYDFTTDPAVPGQFVVTWTMGSGAGLPSRFVTDHPAAGPTGPVSCGTCFPTTRANNSYYYGTSSTPLCPGSALNDGVCDAQWYWTANLIGCTISVEEESWGGIKALYK